MGGWGGGGGGGGHIWKFPLHFLNALADKGVSGMTRTK